MDDRALFPGELERIEYLSVRSPVTLDEMCAILTRKLDLPPFEFGGEDDLDYAFSLTEGIEYNVSRACGEGALRLKGLASPDESNFLFAVSFHQGRPSAPDSGRPDGGAFRNLDGYTEHESLSVPLPGMEWRR